MIDKNIKLSKKTGNNNLQSLLKKDVCNVQNKQVILTYLKVNFNFKLINKFNTKNNIVNKKNIFFFKQLKSILNIKIIKIIYILLKFLLFLKVLNLQLIELNFIFILKNNSIINFYCKSKKNTLIYTKNMYFAPKINYNTININKFIFVGLNKILLTHFTSYFVIKKHNFLIQKNFYMFSFNFIKHFNYFTNNKTKTTLFNIYLYKFLISFLYTRKINNISINILKFFLLRFKKKNIHILKFLLWKNNNLNKVKKIKEHKLSLSYLYYINKIEDKINNYILLEDSNNNIKINQLKNLRNLFYTFLDYKNNKIKSKSKILVNTNKILDFKKLYYSQELLSFLNKKKNIIIKSLNKISFFKNKNKFVLNTKPVLKYKTKNIKKNNFFYKWKKPLQYNIKLLTKKIIYNNVYFNYKYNKELISLIFNFKINIFFINALSLTRFDLHIKIEKKKKVLKKKRSSLLFINKLEREFLTRYKFVANYLQDFARIGFISLYTKDLTFLVKFIAFQISHLQKNRKETKLIRFLIKAIKIFSAQRSEVLALKIEFKGRVNRWRRTKIITGKRGVIPYNSYNTRLEYATATAVTRKGALGIRLWIYYKGSINLEIESSYAKYIKTNKILQYKEFQLKFLK